MLATLRAGLTAALLLISFLPAFSADKPYHRDDLAEAATRAEAQIKADAGTVWALADHLPSEAAEALLELATGGKPLGEHPTLGGVAVKGGRYGAPASLTAQTANP